MSNPSKIIKGYIKYLAPDFKGQKPYSRNEFHWALIDYYEIPIACLGKDVDTVHLSPTHLLSNKWVKKTDLAVFITEGLIGPTISANLFVEIDKSKITDKYTHGGDWAATWITPKSKLFLLPFEIAAAIVGNVIYAHCPCPAKDLAKFSAKIAVELIQLWDSNLFESGLLLKHERFNHYQKVIDFCVFLDEDFAKTTPVFFC